MNENRFYIPVQLDRRNGTHQYINREKVEIPVTESGTISSVTAVLPDGYEVDVPLSAPIALVPDNTLFFGAETVTVNASAIDVVRDIEQRALDAAVQRVSSLDEAVPFSSDVDTLLSLSEVIAAIRGEQQ